MSAAGARLSLLKVDDDDMEREQAAAGPASAQEGRPKHMHHRRLSGHLDRFDPRPRLGSSGSSNTDSGAGSPWSESLPATLDSARGGSPGHLTPESRASYGGVDPISAFDEHEEDEEELADGNSLVSAASHQQQNQQQNQQEGNQIGFSLRRAISLSGPPLHAAAAAAVAEFSRENARGNARENAGENAAAAGNQRAVAQPPVLQQLQQPRFVGLPASGQALHRKRRSMGARSLSERMPEFDVPESRSESRPVFYTGRSAGPSPAAAASSARALPLATVGDAADYPGVSPSSFLSPAAHSQASTASAAPRYSFGSPPPADDMPRRPQHGAGPHGPPNHRRERYNTDSKLPVSITHSSSAPSVTDPQARGEEPRLPERRLRPRSLQTQPLPTLTPQPPVQRLRHRGSQSSGPTVSPRSSQLQQLQQLRADAAHIRPLVLGRRPSFRGDDTLPLLPLPRSESPAAPSARRSSDLAVWASMHVGAQVAVGTFGSVHRAMNLLTGEQCAVKRMRVDGDADRKRAHQEEIRVMQALSHENIVRYLGARFNARAQQLDIFMEYVPGGSVADLVRSHGALSEALVRRFAYQMACGVAYLHRCGVIHRDIKGANVLVTLDGVCKLADFGCSKLLGQMDDAERDQTLHRIRGSIAWMAPEVIREIRYDLPVDMWSLAATVLEMASGERPWPNVNNQVAALLRIAESPNGPPVPASVPTAVQTLLATCFQTDPDARPTIEEFLQDPFFAPL